MSSYGTVEERVARGAAWLDEREPGWWLPGRFNLSEFNIVQPCHCVMGITFRRAIQGAPWQSGYHYGRSLLDQDDDGYSGSAYDVAVELGFDALGFVGGTTSRDFELLQLEWNRVIYQRQRDHQQRVRTAEESLLEAVPVGVEYAH
jgi:hypothetical protein